MESHKKPSRRRRWLWIAVLFFGLLLVIGTAGVFSAESLLKNALSEALGCPVEVDGLSLAWSDPITLQHLLVIGADGRPMLEAGGVRIGGGLAGLALSTDAVHATIERLGIRLSRAAEGGTNLESAVQRMGASGASANSGGSFRRVELAIEEGTLLAGDQHVFSFGLVGSVEGEGPRGRARVEARTTDGGKLTLGILMADATDAAPGISVELRGEGLASERLAPLIGLWTDTAVSGFARRLVVQARLEGATPVSANLEAELENCAIGALSSARPVPELRVRGEVRFRDGRPVSGSAHVETSAGIVDVATESPLQYEKERVAGSLVFSARLPEAGPLVTAFAGLMPAGVEIAGALSAEGSVRGAWPLGPSNILQSLKGITGTVSVRCEGVRTPWCALRQVELAADCDGKHVEVGKLSAVADGARINGSLALPFDGTPLDGHLTIEGELPVTWNAAGLRCSAGLSGRLDCRGDVNAASATLALAAGRLVLEGIRDPVVLEQARITGALAFDAGFSRLHVTDFVLTSSEGAARITEASLDFPGGHHRVNGRLDWDAARVAPWFGGLIQPRGRLNIETTLAAEGGSLAGISGDVKLSLDELRFRERSFTNIVVASRLAGGRMQLNSLLAHHGGGTLTTSGWIALEGARELALDVALDKVGVQESLGGADISGIVSGSVRVEGEPEADFRINGTLGSAELSLQRPALADLTLAELALEIHAGRSGDRLFVERTKLTSKQGSLSIAEATLHQDLGVAAVDAEWNIDGAWLGAIAASAGVSGIELGGRSEGRIRARSPRCPDLDTWEGEASFQLPRLAAFGRDFLALAGSAVVEKKRVTLKDVRCGHQGGTLRLSGNFSLDAAARSTSDLLELEVLDFPLEHVAGHEEEGFRGEVVTTARVSGKVTGRRNAEAATEVQLRLDLNACGRAIRDERRVLLTAPLQPLRIEAGGRLSEVGLRALDLSVRGEDLHLDAKGLDVSATSIRCARLETRSSPALLAAMLLKKGGAPIAQKGALQLGGAVTLKAEDWMPRMDSLEGDIACSMEGLAAGALAFTELRLKGQAAAGRITLQEAAARIADGEVAILPGAEVRIAADGFSADFAAAVKAVDLAKLPNRELAILSPLFFLGDKPARDAKVAGKLDMNLKARCTDGRESWRKTAHADGRIEVRGLQLVSTSMFLEVITQLPALFGARLPPIGGIDVQGALQSVQAALRQGINMEQFATGLTVRKGRLALDRNLAMPMLGMQLTLNGTTGLDGSIACRFDTDIMERLSARAQPSGGVLGALLGASGILSKFRLGIEMQGNIFATNKAEGVSVRPVLGGS